MTADQVKRGDLVMQCCPTDKMFGDRTTKGLQGVEFSTFRRPTMGFDGITGLNDVKQQATMTQGQG